MTDEEKALVIAVQMALSPDLIPEGYRKPDAHPMFGHCYGAAEALYRLLGGKENGYKAQRAIDDAGDGHYWVLTPNGEVLDPTAAQYTDVGETPPYARGQGASFRRPSKRAQAIVERVVASKATSVT
jgi:hypothetical protein